MIEPTSCGDGHDEITYSGVYCPLCELKADYANDRIKLESEIESLDKELTWVVSENQKLEEELGRCVCSKLAG